MSLDRIASQYRNRAGLAEPTKPEPAPEPIVAEEQEAPAPE